MGDILTRGQFGDELTPGFRKIFVAAQEQIPMVGDQIFNIQSSTKPYEEDSEIGVFGPPENFTNTQKISYKGPAQGYNSRYTHVEWALGMQVQYSLWRDSEQGWGYRSINKLPAGLGVSMAVARDKRQAKLFNDGFSVGMTDSAGPGDGLSLFNDAHTYTTGLATIDNAGTSTLTAASLEATRIAMAGFQNDRGDTIGVNPKILLVPRALEQTARQITGSQGDPTSALNLINTQFGQWTIVVWDRLESSTRWYVLDPTYKDMYLFFFEREKLQFDKDTDFDSKIAKWSAYERNSLGYSSPIWAFGHNPS